MRRFVKQYGERRTGTNLLRLLLTSQFPQLEVLMHTLGDKHQCALGHRTLCTLAANGGDWLQAAELRRPAQGADGTDIRHREYKVQIEAELKQALLSERLFYLVSIKDPYAWACSRLKHWGWGLEGCPRPPSHFQQRLEEALESFNKKYANWLALARRHRDRAEVIAYEALLQDPEGVLRRLAQRLGFRLTGEVAAVEGIVLPTAWDNCATRAHFEAFDASFYSERRYMAQLGAEVIRLVRRRVDWEQLAPLGYTPDAPWSPATTAATSWPIPV